MTHKLKSEHSGHFVCYLQIKYLSFIWNQTLFPEEITELTELLNKLIRSPGKSHLFLFPFFKQRIQSSFTICKWKGLSLEVT